MQKENGAVFLPHSVYIEYSNENTSLSTAMNIIVLSDLHLQRLFYMTLLISDVILCF